MNKIIFGALALTVAASSWYAFADVDYQKLKKDVSVMTQILKGAFSADEGCKRCQIQVQGTYLANQGFLFTVNESNAVLMTTDEDDGGHFSYHFSDSDFDALEDMPEMIRGVVAEVRAVMPDEHEIEISREVELVDESTRAAVRDLRRAKRDLQQEIREQEIEIIHLEESERAEAERRIAELAGQLARLEKQGTEIETKMLSERDEIRKQSEQKRQKREQQRLAQEEKVQSRVLQAFCDYGSTLRSLPSAEKVTVIFASKHRSENPDTVFVFNREDVIDCNRDKDKLVSRSLKYQF